MATSPRVSSRIRALIRRKHTLAANVQRYDEAAREEAENAVASVRWAKPRYWRTLSTKNLRALEKATAELKALWPQTTDADIAALLRSRSEVVRTETITSLGLR